MVNLKQQFNKLHLNYRTNNNNNNNIFFIYKLLNPLVDEGSKPSCPEREYSCTEHTLDQMSHINTGKTVSMENA